MRNVFKFGIRHKHDRRLFLLKSPFFADLHYTNKCSFCSCYLTTATRFGLIACHIMYHHAKPMLSMYHAILHNKSVSYQQICPMLSPCMMSYVSCFNKSSSHPAQQTRQPCTAHIIIYGHLALHKLLYFAIDNLTFV